MATTPFMIQSTWNTTPDGVTRQSYITTKHFDMDTSTNTVSILGAVVNCTGSTDSSFVCKVWYRHNEADTFELLGSDVYTGGSQSTFRGVFEFRPVRNGMYVPISCSTIQFKIGLMGKGEVGINDFHFIYRNKKNIFFT